MGNSMENETETGLILVFMEFVIRILHDPNYYHLGNNPATVSFGHAGFLYRK